MSDTWKLLNSFQNNYGGRSLSTEANDRVAFTTMSEEKDEQKKSRKKKEITCFRCKKVGHYTSECNKELPAKMPKSGANMLTTDKDSWHDNNSDADDDDGQYGQTGDDEEAGYDDDEDDKPPETSQQSTAGTECDNETMTLNRARITKGNSMTMTLRA